VGTAKKRQGNKRKKGKGGSRSNHPSYDPTYKLRIVKLRLEEGIPTSVLSEETGICKSAICRWVQQYQSRGEKGLEGSWGGARKRRKRLPEPVREKIREIKRVNPGFGAKRISHMLKRLFCLPGSRETVRTTLAEDGAKTKKHVSRKKPKRNMRRPRFFERSTPNQLWQSDIFTFRLGGKFAYLIGFIDDHSRFIPGLELFYSQTTDNVLEVYRRAIIEHKAPREMLTDNGRQYTSWRGTSRFESELRKDGVHHIKSRPHHPMTLGKIERFWKTIYEEFLCRAQFESFENARERIRLWVRYYNHKRPHQGIGGTCPADRYFGIHNQLRETLEKGIADNILEMALRGKPTQPFYMVGRMDGKSVVLRTEKGKLKLLVNGADGEAAKEVVYSLEKGNGDGEDRGEETGGGQAVHVDGEMPGGLVGMDGASQALGSMQGTVDKLDGVELVAEPGIGGDAAGIGAAGCAGTGAGIEHAAADASGETDTGVPGASDGTGEAVGRASEEEPGSQEGIDIRPNEAKEGVADEKAGERGSGAAESFDDFQGTQRTVECGAGGEDAGDIAQELLRVGAAGSCGTVGCLGKQRERTAESSS
jgi:transposase InsO family protein